MRVLGFQSVGVTVVALGLAAGLSLIPESAEAQRRGGGGRGGGGFRGGGGGGGGFGSRGGAARSSVNRDFARPANRDVGRSVNRDVGRNVNRDVNRNVNRDINRDWNVDVDVDRGWHPVARGVAWGTAAAVTAAAIGSVVYTLPSSCVVTVVNGISYQQCGGVWYAPQMEGSTVSYVVVSPP